MKRGIVIANTGSPDAPTPEAVEVYLRQFLSHPRIAPVPAFIWRRVLEGHILPQRSVSSAEKYAEIWRDGGFQFIRDHIELARRLEASFSADGLDVAVRAGMSFGSPSVPGALDELREMGCDAIDVLPLYPQNAFSQASIVADEARAWERSASWGGELRVVGDYSDNAAYLDAIAASVAAGGFGERGDDRVVFGFHSIPRADVKAGDAYEDRCLLSADAIAARLGIGEGRWTVAFQCRFDKGRAWLGPFAVQVLEELAREGFGGRLFYVCPNFSVDCLETYRDVDVVIRAQWEALRQQHGLSARGDSFVYVPCLGATDAHVAVIRDVLAGREA